MVIVSILNKQKLKLTFTGLSQEDIKYLGRKIREDRICDDIDEWGLFKLAEGSPEVIIALSLVGNIVVNVLSMVIYDFFKRKSKEEKERISITINDSIVIIGSDNINVIQSKLKEKLQEN